ncbi:MAG: Ig-like domain-containing protein [Patescibacteria group bacterium]
MLSPWIYKIKKLKKKTALTAIFTVSVFFFCFLVGTHVLAQSTNTYTYEAGIQTVDQNIALSGTDIRVIISRIINVFLGLLGIIDLSLMIYAGFIWMTSGGDENKISEAKSIIKNAIIGLVIILSAFTIVRFLFNALDNRDGSREKTEKNISDNFFGSGALGSVIKDHYPMRDQTDVPRNTSIVITFAMPIEPNSFIIDSNSSCETDPTNSKCLGDCLDLNNNGSFEYASECDRINTSTIKIINLAENPELEIRNFNNFEKPAEAIVLPSFEDAEQNNIYTIVVRPLSYLGSAMENQKYSVYLSENLKQKNSADSIFIDQYAKYYYWNFEVGTELDLTPPKVENVYPQNGKIISKNEVLQINFSEAIDPTTVSGDFSTDSAFNNILVNGKGEVVSGKWQITNSYKTIEFITNSVCGQNSCGNTMYCLTVNCDSGPDDDPNCANPYEVLINTAKSTNNLENPFEAVPFSGVYDLALNALNNVDNDNNDTLVYNYPGDFGDQKIILDNQKNPDNFLWNFSVRNTIDRSRPYIQAIKPQIDAQNIEEDEEVKIKFSKIMRFNSLKDSILLKEYPEHVCADAALENSDSENCEKLDSLWFLTNSKNIGEEKTETYILHRSFGPNQLDLYYFPVVSSTVQSINQNCLYPGFGPDDTSSAVEDCVINFSEQDGSIISTNNCVNVTENSEIDTACVYTNGSGELSNDVLQPNISNCLQKLETESDSQYEENTQAPVPTTPSTVFSVPKRADL